VDSVVKNRLFKTAPDIDEPPFQFIHTMDLSMVDTMLHHNPDLVIHRTDLGCLEAIDWTFLDAAVQLLHVRCAARCDGAMSCLNTKSLPDICVSLAAI